MALGVVDDMQRAGLGWTSGYWAAALIAAAQDERTLIELTSANRQSRWCWRAPGTLSGCFYEPWSSCMAPAALDRMVTRQLSSFAVGAQLLSARNQTLKTEAVQFLYGRPLAWVRDMGDCIRRRDGLASGGFVNVFVRDSEEKRREANSRRTKMGLPASHAPYVQLFEWLTNTSGAIEPSPAVAFLQTSSSSALTQIVGQRSAAHWSYSNNTRSDHDDWGGWQAAAPDLTTAVAAVNLYIGSHAEPVALLRKLVRKAGRKVEHWLMRGLRCAPGGWVRVHDTLRHRDHGTYNCRIQVIDLVVPTPTDAPESRLAPIFFGSHREPAPRH